MRLDPFVRDYPFMNDFVEALESGGTRFYLDTSLLMWLIRLGTRARAEFMVWCGGRPKNAVRVPVWAAHELHRHVIGGTVRAHLQKTVNETQSKYDEFARLASECAALFWLRGHATISTCFYRQLRRSAVTPSLSGVRVEERYRLSPHLPDDAIISDLALIMHGCAPDRKRILPIEEPVRARSPAIN